MEDQRRQYPPELRERAVRLVQESRADHESEWAAINSVAAKLGKSGRSPSVESSSPSLLVRYDKVAHRT